MSAQNEVAVGLYTKLTGNSALTALLASGTAGVYEGHAPQDASLPYVVFNTQSPSVPRYVGNSGTAWEDGVYQVQGVTEGWSRSSAGTIASKIDLALNAQTLTVTGFTNVHLHRIQDVDYPEVLEGKRFNHRGGLYRIRVAPA